jgi:5-bromo-4-chloroindolyl phosphate hydrolysis protein
MSDEWETLGREIAGLYLINRLNELSTATHALDGKIREDEELTKADIQQFRNALADLQSFVEKDLTAVAEDDIEPYDTALLHVHNQALAEHITGR